MASKVNSRNATPAPRPDDLDNYFLDGDLEDDPFASPQGDKSAPNKRKAPGDGLGLDEEVSVAKKPRAPRIKLDQERLLSQKGIPALRKRARDLKLKGKGHEWGDASRLLSFYQEWLDDLFPKAKFLDALAMVEKAGHNQVLQRRRVEWINEGRPRTNVVDDGGDAQATGEEQPNGDAAPRQAERVAPIFDKVANGRSKTPDLDDLFGDEDDIYSATPVGARKHGAVAETGGEPDDDELDALMAETGTSGPVHTTKPRGGVHQSIFGNGKPKAAASAHAEEEDDLDALMAEAEAGQSSRQKPAPVESKGNVQPAKTGGAADPDEEDDLDALMADAEAQSVPAKPSNGDASAPKPSLPEFNDEEEAMAEMDGLW